MKPSKMEAPLRLARPLTGEVQGESSGAWSVHTRSKFSTLSWPLQLGLKGDLTWRSRLVSILVGSLAGHWSSVDKVWGGAGSLMHVLDLDVARGWLYTLAGPVVCVSCTAGALHL